MHPNLKEFLRKIKCPICKSDVDVLHNPNNFYCSKNTDHYEIDFITSDGNEYFIHDEFLMIYFEEKLYVINKKYDYTNVSKPPKWIKKVITKISVYLLDREGFYAPGTKKKEILYINKDCFDFFNYDQNKFVNKIKTLSVFQ